jgi:hypothetical protein
VIYVVKCWVKRPLACWDVLFCSCLRPSAFGRSYPGRGSGMERAVGCSRTAAKPHAPKNFPGFVYRSAGELQFVRLQVLQLLDF